MSNDGYYGGQQPQYGYGENQFQAQPPPNWEQPPPGWEHPPPSWEQPPPGWEQPPASHPQPGYDQGPPPAQVTQSVPQNIDEPQGQERGFIGDTINKITHHNQPPHPVQQHVSHPSHPLAPIADSNLTTISLTIGDAGNDHDNLVPTHGPASTPAYTIHYNTGDYSGQVWRGPLLFPKSSEQTIVGSWTVHSFHKEKLKFEFPQTKTRHTKEQCAWGFNPDKDDWLSDVGFLNDHKLNWSLIDETSTKVKFTLNCVDVTDDQKRTCCQVIMTSYDKGKVEVPLRIVSNFEQLDEVVTVAVAVMDRCRDNLK